MTRFLLAIFINVLVAMPTLAEDTTWLQIDAQPTEADARDSAHYYESFMPDVAGFELDSGWYVIALGPYTADEADDLLKFYKNKNQIPIDSFTGSANDYIRQFWPVDVSFDSQGTTTETEEAEPEISVTLLPKQTVQPEQISTIETTPQVPVKAPTETTDKAPSRATPEAPDNPVLLQKALAWAEFYDGEIDGAIGPMTRAAIQAWQSVNGHKITGTMTADQSATLIRDYHITRATFGFELVHDEQTGIAIELPLARLKPVTYSFPFGRFMHRDNPQAGVLLISQSGDRRTLDSLFKVMQTLRSVPLGGLRKLLRNRFLITSENDKVISHIEAFLTDGEIKGFALIWPRKNRSGFKMILPQMRKSFTPTSGVLSAPEIGPEPLDPALLAGFEIRMPERNRSGIFVSSNGSLLTTAKAVDGCETLTIDREFSAELTDIDLDAGVALVTPSEPITPLAVPQLSLQPARQAELIVASGYSFEGLLDTPSLTEGSIAATTGLANETDQLRLALPTFAGDSGGPILDARGALKGMLQERQTGARTLPENVQFAVANTALIRLLERNNITLLQSAPRGPVPSTEIARNARDITALVSCWN